MAIKRGLDPVIYQNSRVLILGSLPGDETLRTRRYYSHGRNQFWTILSDVFSEPMDLQYPNRLEFLREKRLALWDVLQSAEREGSLDSAIKNETPNDLVALFQKHPEMRKVAFNGTKAASKYRKFFAGQHRVPHDVLQTAVLPSTSPTPGRNVATYEEKVALWRAFLIG
jgi:double-stranded uracil-DNA glycosylase